MAWKTRNFAALAVRLRAAIKKRKHFFIRHKIPTRKNDGAFLAPDAASRSGKRLSEMRALKMKGRNARLEISDLLALSAAQTDLAS